MPNQNAIVAVVTGIEPAVGEAGAAELLRSAPSEISVVLQSV